MIAESIRQWLNDAGIQIDGPNPWDIHVRNEKWYDRIWRDQFLGLGESYMDEWWECGRLDEMANRLLRGRIQEIIRGDLWRHLHLLPALLINLQSKRRSHTIADRHYNLGNDLFFSFLDEPHKQYSCAYFDETNDLAQAQINKLELICQKLELKADDHVLDIGCGWGGLARYAAEKYGCRVAAVNISSEQLHFAREFCRGLPVQFLDCDYRAIEGRFDKIVSVGMFEHVGYKNYRAFMEVVHRTLKDDGLFLLHTIGGNTSEHDCNEWITRYIFPNGMLPSIAQIGKAVEKLFVVEDWHNLGPHYDKTLMAWNDNFQRAWPRLMSHYDHRFKRMWEFYLLTCAGAFRARTNQVWQVVMTRREAAAPQPRRKTHVLRGESQNRSMTRWLAYPSSAASK